MIRQFSNLDVLCLDPRFAVLDDDHWPTDSPSVASNVDCPLVVVDVHANEFVDLSCSPQFSKIVDKASRITGNPDDGTVDVDNEGSRGIYFSPRCKRNI